MCETAATVTCLFDFISHLLTWETVSWWIKADHKFFDTLPTKRWSLCLCILKPSGLCDCSDLRMTRRWHSVGCVRPMETYTEAPVRNRGPSWAFRWLQHQLASHVRNFHSKLSHSTCCHMKQKRAIAAGSDQIANSLVNKCCYCFKLLSLRVAHYAAIDNWKSYFCQKHQ